MRRNTLLRIKLVVELYKKHHHPDVSDRRIFLKYINPVYPMSLSTFYEYLGTPVDKLLKEQEHDKKSTTDTLYAGPQ